jgi:peptide chain release factor 1
LTLYDLQNIVNGDIQKIIDELKIVQNNELLKNSEEVF